ncbi:hypothetical protein L596_001523 [Steinernema carpocapsae]|uniref:Uncharacterized protein n=1 Tax=Steinernema carpocapsae TaxID=34508 RepID=A0A4U8ULQ7_STECR|nr:hypothetical protein L596_001523 [Steinernema carpocapsae]
MRVPTRVAALISAFPPDSEKMWRFRRRKYFCRIELRKAVPLGLRFGMIFSFRITISFSVTLLKTRESVTLNSFIRFRFQEDAFLSRHVSFVLVISVNRTFVDPAFLLSKMPQNSKRQSMPTSQNHGTVSQCLV